MKSSESLGRVLEQSASFPGRFRRWETDLRTTISVAAWISARLRAPETIRSSRDWATERFSLRKLSRAGARALATWAFTSGLFRRSLVCPLNCGSRT